MSATEKFDYDSCIQCSDFHNGLVYQLDHDWMWEEAGNSLVAYAKFVNEKARVFQSQQDNIMHGALGIATEAGEILDTLKKMWAYSQPLDFVRKDGQTHLENLREEMGDVLFYLQLLANQCGVTILSLMEANKHKLNQRYKTTFSTEEAAARNDKVGLGSVPQLPGSLDLPGMENPGLTD